MQSDKVDLCRMAREMIRMHDYQQAIRLLDQIAEEDRDAEVRRLLDRALNLQDEVDLLTVRIERDIESDQAEGLLEDVERLLELRPGFKTAQRWREELIASRAGAGFFRSRTTADGRRFFDVAGQTVQAGALYAIVAVAVMVFGLTSWAMHRYLRSNGDTPTAQTVAKTRPDAPERVPDPARKRAETRVDHREPPSTDGESTSPSVAAPTIQLRGPVVLTDSAMLNVARQRIKDESEPFFSAWQKVLADSEGYLAESPVPYEGTSTGECFGARLAQSVRARTLALVFLLSDDKRSLAAAKASLLAWARAEGQYPFSLEKIDGAVGVVVGRVIGTFADTYALVYDELTAAERSEVEQWLNRLGGAIRVSLELLINDPGGKGYTRALTDSIVGLTAIGYATQNDELVEYALSDPSNTCNLRVLIDRALVSSVAELYEKDPTRTKNAAAPQAGELYDRYGTTYKVGLTNCQQHLYYLVQAAQMAQNNGHEIDFFAYAGEGGESLEDSVTFYSEFQRTGEMSARTGYYAADKGIGERYFAAYELGRRAYPENRALGRLLHEHNRVMFDPQTFGWSAVLTHGLDDVKQEPTTPDGESPTEPEESSELGSVWRPNEFPIGFWNGPPTSANQLNTWKTVADADFTFVGYTSRYSVDDNKRMLDYCEQVGLKATVVDPRIQWLAARMTGDVDWRSVIDAVIHDYGTHPALYSYFLADEPGLQRFDALGRIHAEFRTRDPKHLPYINLYPSYASAKQLGTPTYSEHLRRYMQDVWPAVLSYDHYCLLRGSDRPDYFENLAVIRQHALKNNVPAWNIIQAMAFGGCRDPTGGEMRWQVYTSLAYGMRGILYFTYWPLGQGQAIVDADGKPTRRYAVVKQLNGEVRTLGKLLLALDSTGVYHTGLIPRGCTTVPADLAVQLPRDLPLLIGCFKDPAGTEYFMLVNRNHQQNQRVGVALKPHVIQVTEIDTRTAGESAKPLRGGAFTTLLNAGEGRLFRLKSRPE